MMTIRRAALVAVVCAVCAPAAAQSLADTARKAEAARNSGAPSLVFDARDLDPARAREELLAFEIDAGRWRRFLEADRRVGSALKTDPAILDRLHAWQATSIRSLERFIQREPSLVAALAAAGTEAHEYAYTSLALAVATDRTHVAAAGSVRTNAAFLQGHAAEVKALAVPPASLAMSAAPGVTRSTATDAPIVPAHEAIAAAPLPLPLPRVTHAPETGPIDVQPGLELPDFPYTDFDGRDHHLSEARGRFVLLDFWGSWCPPCRAELPFVKDAYARFRSRGLEIVGMDYEQGASAAEVRKILMGEGVFWTFATAGSVADLIENRFQITSFPTLILVDPDGVVVRTQGLRGAQLVKTLDRILPR